MEFLTQNAQLIGTVVLTITCFNILLSSVDTVLEKIKDKTASQLDNKLYAVVHPAVGFLKSVLDFLGANREH